MLSITESILIEASLDDVYQAIVDFQKYPKIFNAVKKVKVAKKSASSPRVSLSLNILQRVDCTLDFKLTPKTSLTWKLVEGDMMKRNEGSWLLEEVGKNEIDVTYHLDIDLAMWIPAIVAEGLMKANALQMLKELKRYVEEET